jgi:transcriptional regulator with XRE-family HTH domain
MISAGVNLRNVRERLGLTLREVETASERLAGRHKNEKYLIPTNRLSDFENKGTVPGIHRLYSLAIIYRSEFRELLSWYGVDLNQATSDIDACTPPRSHISHMPTTTAGLQIPVQMDPSFDPRKTSNFARMIRQWGTVPLAYLEQLSKVDYTYGYIGTEDLTMYPVLQPGSFVQIDESRNQVTEGGWRSEYERPIYFIETREGHICSWCRQTGEKLIALPHPLSPVPPKVFRFPKEAEVLGQVIGVAMRLGKL